MNTNEHIINCILIRHGATKGNAQKRYIGCRTDEPLSDEGAKALRSNIDIGEDDMVFVSPLKRAVQTAEIMFPMRKKTVIDDLKETDFGLFEGKNYQELSGDTDYQRWIDSGGTAGFPGGESLQEFKSRSVAGFEKAIMNAAHAACDRIWIVAHGGTLMSVMSYLTGKDYYDFQVSCGKGFEITLRVVTAPEDDLNIICSQYMPWPEDVRKEIK